MAKAQVVDKSERHSHVEDIALWGGSAALSGRHRPLRGRRETWGLLDPESVAYGTTAVQRVMEEQIRHMIAIRFAAKESVEALQARVAKLEGEMDLLREQMLPAVGSISGLIAGARDVAEALSNCLTALQRVAKRPSSDWIPIESFAPENYDVVQSFTAVVSPVDDEFEAGVIDINVHATGDTQTEAVANLKSYLLDLVDHFIETPDEKLGPGPLGQKAFLLAHIKRR